MPYNFEHYPQGKHTRRLCYGKKDDCAFSLYQNLKKRGQSNIILRYYSVGANALALDNVSQATSRGMTSLDNTKTTDKYNGAVLIYNYALSKNLLGEFDYRKVTDVANSANNYHYYRVILTSMF